MATLIHGIRRLKEVAKRPGRSTKRSLRTSPSRSRTPTCCSPIPRSWRRSSRRGRRHLRQRRRRRGKTVVIDDQNIITGRTSKTGSTALTTLKTKTAIQSKRWAIEEDLDTLSKVLWPSSITVFARRMQDQPFSMLCLILRIQQEKLRQLLWLPYAISQPAAMGEVRPPSTVVLNKDQGDSRYKSSVDSEAQLRKCAEYQ